MPRAAGATIGIPPARAVDEADLSVRQPRDEERNLQLPEELYQMESVFPRNIYLGTHDWGKCPKASLNAEEGGWHSGSV
jgi:hypothetical protein